MMKTMIGFCLLLNIVVVGFVRADDEASNIVYVKSSQYGRCYAKCIPAEMYGSKGKTKVYVVREDGDLLETSYDWYSREVYLQNTDRGIAVVRMGPWARGQKASREDLAIGFYLSGKTLKEYSTLDIAGAPENVSRSVSHYTVFKKIVGIRWVSGNEYVFDTETIDGRTISFDIRTGEIKK